MSTDQPRARNSTATSLNAMGMPPRKSGAKSGPQIRTRQGRGISVLSGGAEPHQLACFGAGGQRAAGRMGEPGQARDERLVRRGRVFLVIEIEIVLEPRADVAAHHDAERCHRPLELADARSLPRCARGQSIDHQRKIQRSGARRPSDPRRRLQTKGGTRTRRAIKYGA